ncbi:hypothetical protein [Zooshikella harenae]|uniref:Polysaccharide chain length determinant N-terminal domain-containing protein n=1 Tax=Zooshikella harenae TaxID=2827238 RepID=A0ABS5Z830_9GAMM|nr:hypothetical protein [Zooshikella harenae]MBU2710201.1 hypothetical protein [Zooshikella harenae]
MDNQVPLKNSHTLQPMTSVDDEISLTDIVKVLVIHWRWLCGITSTIIAATLIVALMKPDTYNFVSIYQLAKRSWSDFIEPPEALVQKANRVYYPQVSREFTQQYQLTDLPFKVSFQALKDTGLIMISSDARLSEKDKVRAFHKIIVDKIHVSQTEMVEQASRSMRQQILSGQKMLEQVEGNSQSAKTMELLMRVSSLENQLNELQPGAIIETATQSLKPKGISKIVLIIIGCLLAIMFGMFGAFIVELVNRVRFNLSMST